MRVPRLSSREHFEAVAGSPCRAPRRRASRVAPHTPARERAACKTRFSCATDAAVGAARPRSVRIAGVISPSGPGARCMGGTGRWRSRPRRTHRRGPRAGPAVRPAAAVAYALPDHCFPGRNVVARVQRRGTFRGRARCDLRGDRSPWRPRGEGMSGPPDPSAPGTRSSRSPGRCSADREDRGGLRRGARGRSPTRSRTPDEVDRARRPARSGAPRTLESDFAIRRAPSAEHSTREPERRPSVRSGTGRPAGGRSCSAACSRGALHSSKSAPFPPRSRARGPRDALVARATGRGVGNSRARLLPGGAHARLATSHPDLARCARGDESRGHPARSGRSVRCAPSV